MPTAHVILVDRDDKPIGTEEKLRAHTLGLLHRAFSVFIVRDDGAVPQLLLQRRSPAKYHFGGLWTNTCCGHPRDLETPVEAGTRRLEEEMGIRCELKCVGSFIYQAESANGLLEHEYDHVLIGSSTEVPVLNPAEVEDSRWVSWDELDEELRADPIAFTPWLTPALDIVRNRGH